jgi:hypothetical protein
MKDKEYMRYKIRFLPPATAKLKAIKQILYDVYRVKTTRLDIVDHDDERGIGFGLKSSGDETESANAFEAQVELLLKDGDVHGYAGCGVMMTCSSYGSGIVYAPYNYTEQVGTTDPREIVRRILDLDVVAASASIMQEWLRLGVVTDYTAQPA